MKRDGGFNLSNLAVSGEFSVPSCIIGTPHGLGINVPMMSFEYDLGPGNILTVADDLLKNDGQKFLEMMEQLAERRMQREEEAAADVEDDSEEDSEDDADDGSDAEDGDEADGGSEDDDEEDEDEEVSCIPIFLVSSFLAIFLAHRRSGCAVPFRAIWCTRHLSADQPMRDLL